MKLTQVLQLVKHFGFVIWITCAVKPSTPGPNQVCRRMTCLIWDDLETIGNHTLDHLIIFSHLEMFCKSMAVSWPRCSETALPEVMDVVSSKSLSAIRGSTVWSRSNIQFTTANPSLPLNPGRLTAGTYSHHPFRKANDLNQTSMRTCSSR